MKAFIPILLSLTIISGCSAGADVSCDNQLAANLISDHIKVEVKKLLIDLGSSRIGGPRFEESTIDSVLQNFEPSLDSVRTKERNTTENKKLCASNLTYKFPDSYKEIANKGDNTKNMLLMSFWTSQTRDFGIYATKNSMSYSPGHIGDTVEYSVQPTDDGKQLYVEFGNVDKLIGWISQFSSSVLTGQIAEARLAAISPATSHIRPIDSCVDEKGKKFNEKNGDDALITSDMIDEWTHQCEAGG
jgi:hypothetical protein